MSREPRTLFLARQSYRQRRLRDVLRMLPLMALVLWLIPLLWLSPDQPEGRTSAVGFYVFTVWLLAIIAAGVLSARLRPDDMTPDAGGSED